MQVPAMVRARDLVAYARERAGSDLHLEAGTVPRIRIEGRLEVTDSPAFDAASIAELTDALLPLAAREQLAAVGDCSAVKDDEALGLVRVHGYRAMRGVSLAIRLLGARVPAFEELMLPPSVAEFARCDRGLVIVAGPTGSGKSTTLAALVDRINRTSARRIVTFEDPIEYRFENARSLVTQREIGSDVPSLALALRAVLRADPDVIVVGEMRDGAAMDAALAAAETGHLVLATLHTGDAAQTIDRIVDAERDGEGSRRRVQLAQVLRGVACQRLVRRCGGRGRVPVVEVLTATDAVRATIREGRVHLLGNAIAMGRRHGMQTLEQHAADLVQAGFVDPDEVRRQGLALQAAS